MGPHHVAKVHSVELVTRKDQHVFDPILLEMDQVLANGVGRALVPVGPVVDRLLRGQQLHEAAAEVVKEVRLSKMAMQALGKKLRQHIGTIQTTVDAVADRNIDQAILGRERNGGLCPNLRQGKESTSRGHRRGSKRLF